MPRARRTLMRAASLLPGDRGARARFVRCRDALDAGHTVPGVLDLVADLLSRADAALREGRREDLVDWADKALQLAFHATVHYGQDATPTASADLPHLAPFRDSAAGRLLLMDPDRDDGRAPRRAGEDAPAPSRRDGGRRVLVLCAGGTSFIERVARELEPRDEVRILDPISRVGEVEGPSHRPTRRSVIAARLALCLDGERLPIPASLREDLDWADVVVVEWANLAFTWVTLWEQVPARLVARLHRFESRTPYPALADMTAVDAMVFVAEHMRALVQQSAPRLSQAREVVVIGNLHDLSTFETRKEPGAERTLVQVGWDRPVKDVEHTLAILETLRAEDPRWRLLLVGPAPSEDPRSAAHSRRVSARSAALGDAVEALGQRDDVPAVLRRARWLISASRHEGTHESVAEGAAAACVPVVRDWPEARAWGGAATVYPEDWVVQDAAEAASRILRISAVPGAAAEAGEDARRTILERRRSGPLLDAWRSVLDGPAAEQPA